MAKRKKKKLGKLIPVRFGGKNERFYMLDVSLLGGPITQAFAKSNSTVFRTIEICGGQTLADLHDCIFEAFDRHDQHMYEFQVGGKRPMDPKARRYGLSMAMEDAFGGKMAGDVERTTLDSLGLEDGDVFGYWFDFGDDWWHQVSVISVDDDIPPGKYPRVIDREGDSPPQYADFEDDDFDDEDDFGDDDDELFDETDFLNELITDPEGLVDSMLEEYSVEPRERVEDKPLKPDTTLAVALKKQPAIWVEAIYKQYDTAPPKRVADKIQALLRIMSENDALANAWARLPEPSRRMLYYLLVEKEGWVQKHSLSKRFGKDEDRSWFWNEGRRPITALGILRLNGLVFVGTRKSKGRKETIVSVPVELREILTDLTKAVTAFENAPPMPKEETVSGESDNGPGLSQIVMDEDFVPPDEMDLKTFLAEIRPSEAHARFYRNAVDRFCGELRKNETEEQRELLLRTSGMEEAALRRKAYQAGYRLFGKSFIEPALHDFAKSIRDWAKKKLNPNQGELF